MLSHLCVLAAAIALGTAKECLLPEPGGSFQQANPDDLNLDADIVQQALRYASTHNRISVQVFRNNCRVESGIFDSLTDGVPNNVWSCTKSVVSILTGMAMDRGALGLDDEIGKYLPQGPSWGDAAHRAMTVRDLLTETSGLSEAIASEAITVVADQSAPQEALAQVLKHEPGTVFEYTQRVPDLLLYVVQRALGIDDIQEFAQQELFDPIGIDKDSYLWLRDRSGYTYGYAWLFLPPTQLAKLGLLVQNGGSWNGHRVLSTSYLANAAKSSPRNPCYGWLFWTNEGLPCTGANIPSSQTFDRRAVPSAPDDMFAMVGAFHQNNFIVPSLNMTVTWTGFFGDTEPNLSALLSSSPADLYYNFFRIMMKAVRDVDVPDPGPFKDDSLDLDINPTNYASPRVLLSDIEGTPGCNLLFCNNTIPTQGVVENLQSIAAVIGGTVKGDTNSR